MTDELGKDLIHLLTSQTFEMADQKTMQDLRVRDYSRVEELGLIADIHNIGLNFWVGEFCPFQQTFRFVIQERVVDFPRNWSIFPDLERALKLKQEEYFILDEGNDPDMLAQILFEVFAAERYFFATYQNQVLLIADRFSTPAIESILQRYCCPPLPFAAAA